MKSREELIKTKSYWLVKIQSELYANVEKYMSQHNLTRTDFANQLGVSKGYISQVLNGDFNHSLSKLIELSLTINKAPFIEFMDLEQYILEDKLNLHEIERTNRPIVNIEINYRPNITLKVKNKKSYISSMLTRKTKTITPEKVIEEKPYCLA